MSKKPLIKALTPNQIKLFMFIRRNNILGVKKLLEQAEDIEINKTMSNTGLLSLHTATYWGHIHMVVSLLKLGANPESRNYVGETAVDVAKEKGHRNILSLLLHFKNVNLR